MESFNFENAKLISVENDKVKFTYMNQNYLTEDLLNGHFSTKYADGTHIDKTLQDVDDEFLLILQWCTHHFEKVHNKFVAL